MKTADLYIRVSTDEQAEKGFSQRDQEERLRKYCQFHQIDIRHVIFEDYSAKTFERPEWRKYLATVKKQSAKPRLVLFTKWDRFSRNAGDAYQMIAVLRKLNIDPQAIEQPLDMSIPESKIMLAVYLATPEVENDRRSLNVFNGMRRARKEGRWMAVAPKGYKNKTDETGRKFIDRVEPDATIVGWAFQEIAKGIMTVEAVRKLTLQRGLKMARGNFYYLVRNPVYCGYIQIMEYKDEEAHIVLGKHEPIIDSETFFRVQDILDGRVKKRRPGVTATARADYPLRGFLFCPKCGKALTASRSKGRGRWYSYYHCKSPCKTRFTSEFVNESFAQELEKYTISESAAICYEEVLIDVYKAECQKARRTVTDIPGKIKALQDKIDKARDLTMSGAFDAGDYKKVKFDCDQKIAELQRQLVEIGEENKEFPKLLRLALKNLRNIDRTFRHAEPEMQRSIIGSLFSERIVFDGHDFHNTKISGFMAYIFELKDVGGKRGKQSVKLQERSGDNNLTSTSLLNEMRTLASLRLP